MHYVIGDVHGCYEALMILLKKLHLTPEDVVTFVGDFVDREPSREQYDKLVYWFVENITDDGQFRSVIGNHDYDYYRTMKLYENGLDMIMSVFPEDSQVEIQRQFADKLGKLPLYHEYTVHGIRNIVTHSWLVDRNRRPYFVGEDTDGGYNVEGSIWDRHWSLRCDPEDVRVIHGHTIVVSQLVTLDPDKGSHIANRVCRYGNNINVDCGCFMGVANRGNLAAVRLEDDAIFYAYTDEDVVEECKRLAARSDGALKDHEIFISCARYPISLLARTDHAYINECREKLLKECGAENMEEMSFADWLQGKTHLCRSRMERLSEDDRAFIIWN